MKDTSIWIEQLLVHLGRYGPQGEAAARFILERRVKVSIHDQLTGARWTINRNIQLHPRFVGKSPEDPYSLSLIVHEVRHLEQGIFTALSVYGELDAWQLQFSFIKSLIGRYHQDAAYEKILNKLMSLNLDWNRKTLTRARELMKEYAGKAYRIDLLPLYPLHREVYFFITRKRNYMI